MDPLVRLLIVLRYWRELGTDSIPVEALADEESGDTVGDLIDAALALEPQP